MAPDQDRVANLLDQLREEALDVKKCFTNFVFQSATVAAAALAFILLNIKGSPFVVLTAAPVLVLMVVCRIGVFKFTTANRNFGYQLHLARMHDFLARADSELARERIQAIVSLDWEVALRAWRVVQVAVFRTIYRTPRFTGLWGRISPKAYTETQEALRVIGVYKGDNEESDEYPWWNPELLTKLNQGGATARSEESIYYTGTYLRDMLASLHTMQWLLLAPVAWVAAAPDSRITYGERSLLIACAVLCGAAVLLRQIRIKRRRDILENQALSIHSCAITWAYVAILHLVAANDGQSLYQHYTQRLARACRNSQTNALKLPFLTRQYILWQSLLSNSKRRSIARPLRAGSSCSWPTMRCCSRADCCARSARSISSARS